MIRMRRAGLVLGLLFFALSAARAGTAQEFIESLLADYRTMKPGSASELSVEDQAHNDSVRKRLLAQLNVEKLGRLALTDHWEKLTPERRTEFLSTLRTVLEQRSFKNIKGAKENFEVQYDGVDELPEGEALVKTILQVKNDEFYVDFKLEPHDASWAIYDVITDDVSTVRNYRDQFNKIIADKGFDELLHRMRDNLLEEPATKKEPGAG